MKTRTLIESIKSRAFYLMLCVTMAVAFSACSEEVLEEDIVGKYYNNNDDGLTDIIISKSGSLFNFTCEYIDNSNVDSSEDTPEYYKWSGTFSNYQGDNILNNNGDIIGDISFRKAGSEITVKFTAKTQRKGTYTASKGGDYAEYIPSRSIDLQDSLSIKSDTIKSDTIKTGKLE